MRQSSFEREWNNRIRHHIRALDLCWTLQCVCRVSQGLRISCVFPKDLRGISSLRTGLPACLVPTVFFCEPHDPCGISRCLCRVLLVVRISLWFCVSLVPRELCGTSRCVKRVLQVPGTNRLCVYCGGTFRCSSGAGDQLLVLHGL